MQIWNAVNIFGITTIESIEAKSISLSSIWTLEHQKNEKQRRKKKLKEKTTKKRKMTFNFFVFSSVSYHIKGNNCPLSHNW